MKLLHEAAAVSASSPGDKTSLLSLRPLVVGLGQKLPRCLRTWRQRLAQPRLGGDQPSGKDLLKMASAGGRRGVRIDALVNEGRAILDEVMPRSGDTPEVAAAKMKKRDNEF